VTYEAAPKRFLLLPSIAFDSSVAGIFWTLASGGALVVPTDDEVVDARRLVQLVTDARVTTLLCVPSLYAQMLRFGGDRLRGLDTVIVAGEVCPSHLVQEHFRVVPEVRLFNEYGPTEATVWATAHEVTSRDAERPVPIGSPIPGVDVHVLDTRGRRVPVGIPGQAWIAGRTVAQGYWKRRDLTERHFIPDHTASEKGTRTYRTGDRVAWTADGTLLFLGREDDQIKLRGFRIEPGEIESLLLEQSDVEDAAVVARGPKGDPFDSGFQEPTQLVGFLETTGQGTNLSRRDVLLNRLPDFMVPQRFVELPALPRLPNGKLDRTSLRRMALEVDPADDVPEERQPATDQERALMALWEGLLGRSGIGVTDNFFELGGHSLLVVEMAHAIERDHGVPLVAADVFQNPTIRELARRVERNRGSVGPQYAHLFPIQPGGRDTPFIVCIPHFFSQMLAERFRGERPVYGLRGVGLRPEGNVGRWPTMTDLGRELVDEVCRRFPGERYILAGYSFGASMAFEAVRQMEEQGLPVERLYLIAPMPLDFVSVGPLRVQVGGLRQPIEALSFWEVARLIARDLDPRTRRPYDRAFQLLCTRPWRRLLCLVGKLRTLAGFPLTPRILHAAVRLERFRLHRRFRPQPVRTPTVVFNPREPTTDTAATWRPHFEGPFTVVDTPDPHGDASSIEQARALILRRFDRDEAEGS
jgi:pimeloyl-ACP methyl ester carboxylesterase